MIFPCGCKFAEHNGKPQWDIEKTRLDCPHTWRLISSGRTQGVFQLEKKSGKDWSRKIRPENIEELSDIAALIRPGCTQAMLDNKNLTQHYTDRKHGDEPVPQYHPVVDAILAPTQQILVYQEQSLEIVKSCAHFTLEEADNLRRAIGKKDTKEMAKVKAMFLEKAREAKILTDAQAEEVFGWIESSQRYSFNKCLHEDTVVNTRYGNKAIKDVQAGEEVLCPTPDGKATRYCHVVAKYYNGQREVYDWSLVNDSYSLNLVCTKDHKVLCEDGVMRPIMDAFGGDHWIVGIKGYLSRIRKSSYVGLADTYDLEIDSPEHVFFADGIAVSNSHSCSYGLVGYLTAYAKAHFPLQFYCSWLRGAGEKPNPQLEVYSLVNDAKLFDIEVCLPDLRDHKDEFYIKDGKIYFGLSNIRDISAGSAAKLAQTGRNTTWMEFLTRYADLVNSKVVVALIKSGALDYTLVSRARMCFEYSKWQELTDREKEAAKTVNADLVTILERVGKVKSEGGVAANAKRAQAIADIVCSIKSPPFSLQDTPEQIANNERHYLGVSVRFNKVDACNFAEATKTCKEVALSKTVHDAVLVVELGDVLEILVKNGKNAGRKMARCQVSDGTAEIDCTVFSDQYEQFGYLLIPGNTVSIKGWKKDNFVAREICQAI